MRLIDADAVELGFDELCRSPYFKHDVNAKHGAETLMDVCVRTDSHMPNTIDPESLPIVRQLREELAREKRLCDNLQKDLAITANERDAALERVKHYAGCWECKVREEGTCAMPFFKDECSDWEWRGPQKEE